VDECEKGIRRSFSVGGCASADSAEDGGATGSARGAPQTAGMIALHLPLKTLGVYNLIGVVRFDEHIRVSGIISGKHFCIS